ncbi:FtsX-like permease family protein [Actinomycetes bacterium KLBMP 9797]
MTAWWTALRIARREARRAKGRSALVVAMIALPVLALTFAAASYDMFQLTPDEKATQLLGTADARVEWAGTGTVTQSPDAESYSIDGSPVIDAVADKDVLAQLPGGGRVTQTGLGMIELRTAAGVGRLNTREVDLGSPLVDGFATLLDGRAPTGTSEVALTRQAVGRLDAGVGDTVQSVDRSRSWTVTGIVEFPSQLQETIAFPAGAMPAESDAFSPNVWLWDAPGPVTWTQVRELNQHGFVVLSRAVLRDPPPAAALQTTDATEAVAIGGLVAGLGVLEVVLLAGPAFAVGARRRQRELALVAANGGTPAHLRRIVLADGVVLGALAAAVGLVLGVLAAFALRPLIELYVVQARAGGYRVFPLALLAIVGVAVGTGLLGALVPAFTAARVNVVAALTGRRGVHRSRKRWLALGLALVAGGTGVAAYGAWESSPNVILAGLIVGQFGLVLCTPALVGLIARLGRVLPLTPRIALRDTARNRAAAAPAIAAVMAAVAGSVAIGVILTADSARLDATYRASMPLGNARITHFDRSHDITKPDPIPDLDTVAATARRHLPAAGTAQIGWAVCADIPPAKRRECGLGTRLPKDQECPYANDTGVPLSRADQRAARRDARCAHGMGAWGGGGIQVGDGSVVPALTGATGAELARARATLDAGGVVVDNPRYLVDGKVTLELYDPTADGDGTITPEKAAKLRTLVVPGYAPRVDGVAFGTIVSPAAVRAAGYAVEFNGIVVATERMPTQDERDALSAALFELNAGLQSTVEARPSAGSDPIMLILAAAAGLITLGAAGIATGLAAADGRADLATLGAVGASPGVRRRLSLSQSGVIAGLGSVLGVLAGLGASVAVLVAYNQASADRWPVDPPYPLGVPWTTVAVVLVVPVVAMLGAGLLTRSRLPVERRRA